jgi:hypothetical protein
VWKIDLTALDAKIQLMLPTIGVQMQPAVTMINTLASDVEAGKYNTVDEVKAAIQKQMAMTFGGAQPKNLAGSPAPVAPPQ